MISMFAADPVLALIGLALFPSLFLLNRFYTRRVEDPAAAIHTLASRKRRGAEVTRRLSG